MITGLNGLTESLTVGLNPSGGAVYPATAGDTATAMGRASGPSNLYLIDNASSLTDKVGSDNLSAVNSPSVANDSLLGTTVGNFALNASAGFNGASNSVFDDDGATSWAWVMVLRITDPGTEDILVGKYTTTPGYFVRNGGGGNYNDLRVQMHDGTSWYFATTTAATYDDGNVFVLSWGVDRSATNEVFAVTDRESKVTAAGSPGSMSNSATFQLGTGYLNSIEHKLAWAARFTGTAAEGITQTHCQNLKSSIGV